MKQIRFSSRYRLNSGRSTDSGRTSFWLTKYTNLKIWLILLILVPPFWITTRTADIWTGQDLEDLVRQFATGRADSLHTRLVNERKLVDRGHDGAGGKSRRAV